MMFCRMPQLPHSDASFQWVRQPPLDLQPDVRFYIDGSATDPTVKQLTQVGFSIVVVSIDGDLIGIGCGTPPPWIDNSGGAEAWAFYAVLSMTVHVPIIITDYLGILNGLAGGRSKAASPSRSLARIWNMIFNCLDCDHVSREVRDRVVWMPSHGARHAIGEAVKSDDSVVSAIDWRANRLADAAAKAAAFANRSPAAARIKLQRTLSAYEHALTELAVVTTAANYHPMQIIRDDGTVEHRIARDSAPAPRRRRLRTYRPLPPLADERIDPSEDFSSRAEPSPATKRAAASDCRLEQPATKWRRMHRDHVAIMDGFALAHWRQERSKRSFQAVSATPASVRLAALRARVNDVSV